MEFSGSKKTRALICLLLAVVTLGVYWQVHGFGFVNLDDTDYVTENPMVKRGLTFGGIVWAFTHFHSSNWHPLTWISHMLDCQLFGLNPAGPHIVNVLFHAANSVLLFLLLQRLTGTQWRSAIVAGLFAWHPLHVESVAWISERKDVLSTFFGLLSLLAYTKYADEMKTQGTKIRGWRALSIGLFALSLLAKPMLVTLSFVMLLLDLWPLQRIDNHGWRTFLSKAYGRLVKEKLPWFALVTASCAVTLAAQAPVMATAARFPIGVRLVNAIESYFWYAEKTFWPTKLAAFYPMEYERQLLPFILMVLWLVVACIVAVLAIRRRPFLFVGWFWFIGTLVPVVGLVQVGSQGMADRYSYVPLIGLFIVIVWTAHDIFNRSKTSAAIGGLTASAALAALTVATYFQAGHWKSTFTLFSHAVAVTDNNDFALAGLGGALYEMKRDDDALKMYRLSLEINPRAADVHKDMGLALARKGDSEAALQEYEKAVELEPGNAVLQNFLAETLAAREKNDQALPHFIEAARLKPDNAQFQNDLAVALVAAGKRAEATEHYQWAALLEPGNARYQNNLATALLRTGDFAAALEHYRAAIAADPKFAEPCSNLGALFFYRRQYDDAAQQYQHAMQLNPTDAGIRFNAARTFLKLHDVKNALAQFTEAARLRPDWPDPLNAQAWVLATAMEDKTRNGAEAVKLAEKAVDLSFHQQALALNTLAAAYAEAGRFDDATNTANQALELATHSNQTHLVGKIQHALDLYKTRAPFREDIQDD